VGTATREQSSAQQHKQLPSQLCSEGVSALVSSGDYM
jgi:hypothetical protein